MHDCEICGRGGLNEWDNGSLCDDCWAELDAETWECPFREPNCTDRSHAELARINRES
jgi:hypothetical protein